MSLLPSIIRQKLGLGPKYDFSVVDRMVVKTLGAYLNRKAIPGSPPCDASLRIGLPENFLYMNERKRAQVLDAWRGTRPQPAVTTAVQPAE